MSADLDLSQIVNIFSWISILIGSFFVLVGGIGLLRMPDIFTRMHAASITDTVGAGFLILGMIGQAGLTLVTIKLIFILVLLAITSPVASHALAQAALHENIEPILSDDRRERSILEDAPIAADNKLEDAAAAADNNAMSTEPTTNAKNDGGARS